MKIFIKHHAFLIILLLVAAFFYTFRLNQTFILATDTARDLVRVMEIWNNKEITLIGPPLNTINNNPIEVYFGSMHYYFGIVGLIISRFNPVGSVYLNILLTEISIPFFYYFSKKLIKNKKLNILTTIIYGLSPVTLAFARSYWNPNLIIPLSVFFWYAVTSKKGFWGFFGAGIISGVIFNLHYMDFIPIMFFALFILFDKNKKLILGFLVGLVIALSPLIIFELRHNLFLTRALILNLGGFSRFSNKPSNPFLFMDSFLYIFGLGPSDFYLPGILNLSYTVRIIIDSVLGIAFLSFSFWFQKIFNKKLIATLVIGLVSAWYLETFDLIHLRYIFSIYPILITVFTYFLYRLNKYLPLLLLIPTFLLSFKIITYQVNVITNKDFYPLSVIEPIAEAIVKDNPSARYNVTENILGDARSLAFRYYLLRDAKVKPQPVTDYPNLDTLYLITPSLEKTYKENRWEFSVSGTKNIAWEKDFGDLKLYKFTK